MKKKTLLVLMLLVAGLFLLAGCTSSPATPTAAPTTEAPADPSAAPAG